VENVCPILRLIPKIVTALSVQFIGSAPEADWEHCRYDVEQIDEIKKHFWKLFHFGVHIPVRQFCYDKWTRLNRVSFDASKEQLVILRPSQYHGSAFKLY